MEMHGKASVHIEAAPDVVYSLISDITRMGEWSPECEGGDWTDGSAPAVGAQFHGRNRRGDNEWTTPNTVIAADAGREFAWVVGTPEFQVCTWRFSLTPENGGTTVTESFELGKEEVGFRATVLELPEDERPNLINARTDQLVEDIRHTLASLKEAAERG